jgi:protein TonB
MHDNPTVAVRTPRAGRRAGSAIAPVAVALALLAGCGRPAERRAEAPVGPARPDADALARDRAERVVLPLVPPGTGEWRVEQVAPARAELDPPLPAAEPADPASVPGPEPEPEPDGERLKPPIARGLPSLVRAGPGGRVTFDVRVDEQGEVSDVELVASEADSLTVAAAAAVARATRYHPARMGERAVAVWCRQVFDVRPARGR